MSEPEQPEPEVAEAGPGNAGSACFVRLMPDLLQFPSTDIHGQNVTVNIHVTRMSQCIFGKLQESTNGVYATTLSNSFKQGQHG